LFVKAGAGNSKTAGGQSQFRRRKVLKDDNRFKERHSPRNLAPTMNVDQRNIGELVCIAKALLKVAEPFFYGAVFIDIHPDRQRIDEETEHVLGVGQIGRAARHGRAKQDIRAPAVAAEQESPGPLDECVECDSHRPRKPRQLCSRGRR
jgi:hypothetical protein